MFTQCYQLQIGEEGSYSSQCSIWSLPKVFCRPHQGNTGPWTTRVGTIFQWCHIRDGHGQGSHGGAVWCAEKDKATQCSQRSNRCWSGQVSEASTGAKKATTSERFATLWNSALVSSIYATNSLICHETIVFFSTQLSSSRHSEGSHHWKMWQKSSRQHMRANWKVCHFVIHGSLVTSTINRTLWGQAWASSYIYYGYMHMNTLSFMVKWWTESLAFMSVVYAWPLPENLNLVSITCMLCKQPAVDGQSVAAVTNKK